VRRLAGIALLALAAGLAAAQHGHQPMHQRFEDAERWARVFEDPARDAWQKPEEVIRALALAPAARVADIGAATGYFAVRLARALPQGRVYGVDIEPDMTRYLGERAERERLANLSAHLGAPDDPKLPENVHLVLVVNVYHHIGERPKYFSRLKSRLQAGGRVAVIDFRLDSPVGPPRRHRIAAEAVLEEMRAAGYRLAERHEFLPHQYFLVFAPG
jgi:SAM-dependent methyltransferase